jgi:hypothetical protein
MILDVSAKFCSQSRTFRKRGLSRLPDTLKYIKLEALGHFADPNARRNQFRGHRSVFTKKSIALFASLIRHITTIRPTL